jgi:succinate-semialdehyde dehydrogenase/glutarate-semialdehyde dehydrogenase
MTISESDLLARVPDRLFIGGEWVASTSGRGIDVTDPSTGLVIKTIADASVADAARAMDAAAAAQTSWASTAQTSSRCS